MAELIGRITAALFFVFLVAWFFSLGCDWSYALKSICGWGALGFVLLSSLIDPDGGGSFGGGNGGY